MQVTVTTPLRADAAAEAEAAAAAARHGLEYVPRRNRSAEEVLAASGAAALLVLSPSAAVLVAGGRETRWSPGMGLLRAKRLAQVRDGRRAGDPSARDPFVEAAGFLPGERVLDCTVGLGADALVAAEAVGAGGEVVGLERAPALAAWVAEGLRRLPHPAARRVTVRAADHAAALAAFPDRSFDVVVFDPMFRYARAAPGGFDAVRALADATPLAAAAVARARRVARRLVVVKDGAPGWDLTRLGLVPRASARGAHRYYGCVGPA